VTGYSSLRGSPDATVWLLLPCRHCQAPTHSKPRLAPTLDSPTHSKPTHVPPSSYRVPISVRNLSMCLHDHLAQMIHRPMVHPQLTPYSSASGSFCLTTHGRYPICGQPRMERIDRIPAARDCNAYQTTRALQRNISGSIRPVPPLPLPRYAGVKKPAHSAVTTGAGLYRTRVPGIEEEIHQATIFV
jgi:hypothetical protein